MLIGEHQHTFDDKGRISLPAKFRKELGSTIVIAPGIDNCLFVFTVSEWKTFANRLSMNDNASMLRTDNRNFNRLIIGRAVETSVDSIGRILVPEHLRKHAGLADASATIIGVMNRLEIWNADVWSAYREEFGKKTDVIAEKLSSAGMI